MRNCSISNALDIIGERWTLVALREIMLGNRRFEAIVRNTGASRDILATRLRKLVDAGVLEKRRYEDHPPRYEYLLTRSGETPWVSRRLGLLDPDQGLVGPVCIVERGFELDRWDVAKVAV